jgi:hypothetical protein
MIQPKRTKYLHQHLALQKSAQQTAEQLLIKNKNNALLPTFAEDGKNNGKMQFML